MTGVEGIPDDVLERAVEAAAKYEFESMGTDGPCTWESLSNDDRSERTEALWGVVTAALAEVEASITAERDEKRGSPEHRPIVQHVALTPTDDGGWAPRTMAQVETGRITITRTLLDDGDDVIDLQRNGDAEHAVTALGMLAMASDWVLHDQDGDALRGES